MSRVAPGCGCRAFGIDAITVGDRSYRVLHSDLIELPFGILSEFTHPAIGPRRVLVVPPLAGSFPFLLRDLVIGLLRHSRLAVAGWVDARYVGAEQGEFGLRDQVDYVASMIRTLGPGVDVVAVCQGGVPALIATAQISEEEIELAPRTLTLVAAPIDPLAFETRLVQLARSYPLRWFEDNVIAPVPRGYPGESRLVYPASQQLVTVMAYIGRHMAGGGEMFRKFLNDDGEDPIRFPFARLCLSLMDLPATFFLENIRYVFQDRALCSGAPSVLGRRMDFRAIRRTALMTVEGELDDICGPGQTYAAHILCSSVPERRRAHLFLPGAGHFSLFHGQTCRRTVLPAVAALWRETV